MSLCRVLCAGRGSLRNINALAGIGICRKICTSRMLGMYWNKDWQPGPYPQTKEERLAAARKYGLIPEDYEPYDDDGMGHGDYPKLPYQSEESRNPDDHWDMPAFRRNFGEPLHRDFDLITGDKWDSNRHEKQIHPDRWYVFLFLGCLSVVAIPVLLTPHFIVSPPIMPKQFPYSFGTPRVRPATGHYTFELEDE